MRVRWKKTYWIYFKPIIEGVQTMNTPYNPHSFNVGNSIFPGFNDKNGLVVCGYEWGYSKKDRARQANEEYSDVKTTIDTFLSKVEKYNSPYDKRILKWFKVFGHELGRESGFSGFDKLILQTNWCDTQGAYVSDYNRFLSEENINNFLRHMSEYQPTLLLFMGVRQIECLQDKRVQLRFREIFGEEKENLRFERDNKYPGRKFRIGFQRFERISILALPHPSGSRGLSDDYISLFKAEIGTLIVQFKHQREFSLL
jgi:hypothetical protein